MKNILITGANSYIGTSVEKWLLKKPDKYHIETLDMKDENWRSFDFSKFDVVFHVAGIAHIKETKKNRGIYFKVNRDLAIETAVKSKESGVKHFIFLSTMSIYGINSGIITQNTVPNPKKSYGKSKYEAEREIIKLISKKFKVLVVRPPMIYGPNSPGNYQKLSKLAKKIPFYPKINNKRSMLFIDNLCKFIYFYINNTSDGIALPQNDKYVNTTEMLTLIRIYNDKPKRETKMFNLILKVLISFSPNFNKVFGSLYYQYPQKMENLHLTTFEDSIVASEKKIN